MVPDSAVRPLILCRPFAQVVESILISDPNFDFKNGREFTRRFCNHSWFVNGSEVFIDEAGERGVTLLVRDLNGSTGTFEVN